MMNSVNSNGWNCTLCGGMVWAGMHHTCSTAGLPLPQQIPAPFYFVQCCPVCQGRGNVPAGFYSRMAGAADTSAETCQGCDGKGMLKIGLLGTVEKIGV